ncbi:hypothetical protein [Virgibacillus ainsalahensis]
MSEKRYVDVKELERFLWFLLSKSDSIYEKETEQAVRWFIAEIGREKK